MAKWYVVHGDQERGPFEDAQLKEFAATGKLKPDHQIRRDVSTTTRMAKDIKGLFPSNLRERIDQKQIPPPLPDSKSQSEQTSSSVVLPQPIWTKLLRGLGNVLGIIVLVALMAGFRAYLDSGKVKKTARQQSKPATHVHEKPKATMDGLSKMAAQPVPVAGKYGYIDKSGKVVIPPQFALANPFSDGLASVKAQDKWGFINAEGKYVIEPRFIDVGNFSEGLAAVKERDKYGVINTEGKYAVEPRFDHVGHFSEGLAEANLNGKTVFIDKAGIVLFECDGMFHEFKGGVSRFYIEAPTARAPNQCLYGLINSKGKVLIPPKFTIMSEFANGRAIVWLDDESSAIIDTTGQFIVQPTRNMIFGNQGGGMDMGFSEGLVAYQDKLRGNFVSGYVDTNGKPIIPALKAQLDISAVGFSEGVAAVGQGQRLDDLINLAPPPPGYGKRGYIDKTGAFVIPPQFESGNSFSGGLAAVRQTTDGKWAYIDKTGKIVIQPRFDQAEKFLDGLACVSVNEREGVIDTKGNFVVEPKV